MSEDFNLRSGEYWRRMGWGLLTGLLSAIGAFIFIALMNLGKNLIWPDLTDWTPFSGSWLMVGIMTVAGLVVGIIHHFSAAAELDVFAAVDDGDMDPKPVPASLLASLVSLIGGFSLGPEVPTGMLAAGLGGWISRLRKLDAEGTRINVISGISAAYAGLFSSPFVVLLLLLESAHLQSIAYYGTLLIAGLSATIGFSLFYGLGGDAFSSLLGLLSPPAYDLRIWHLGVALVLGLVAVPFGLLLPILTKILGRLTAPLKSQPIVRGLLGGFLLGLLAFALPTTIGLGTNEMAVVSQQAAEIGFGLLIVFALGQDVGLERGLVLRLYRRPDLSAPLCGHDAGVGHYVALSPAPDGFGGRMYDGCRSRGGRAHTAGAGGHWHVDHRCVADQCAADCVGVIGRIFCHAWPGDDG